VPHLNKYLALFTSIWFYQEPFPSGVLTGIATINLLEFFFIIIILYYITNSIIIIFYNLQYNVYTIYIMLVY